MTSIREWSQRLFVLLILQSSMSGCYYMQATVGHLDLMRQREPIQEVIDKPETGERLRGRLELVVEARDFSIRELSLPDNESYRSFAALERDYVLWSLFAAPVDSLEPKTWCYPFVGCLGYRGYFRHERVMREAEKLQAEGLDVAVSGVIAYSTLGKFDDPLVDTMMRWDDTQLVGTLFHELAHQVVYIKDDTMFNESFATAVEELGLERWLHARRDQDALDGYFARKRINREILELVERARPELETLYLQKPAGWQVLKRQRLDALSASVSDVLVANDRPATHWLSGEINNAHLIPVALYEGQVAAFRSLFMRYEEQFECFYAEVKRLGGMSAEARRIELESLAVPSANLQHH
jgi:predicted aminopeptidase